VTEGLSLSREALLAGMPARRASTIVFAIEGLTRQLVLRSRRALARYQPARDARDRERQFLDAVGGARERQARPAIQDVERYADEWAHLVPEGAELRAAILHQLSTHHRLDPERCRRIRAALAVDTEPVAEAYRRQQGRPIDAAWTPATGWRERLRWWRAGVAERLETMPPFWTAFSLTLTETVGGGMLALPIALAGVGVAPGLVLLAVFGLISILTIAALVEAITRDGRMRYGSGYFGQLVANRLGRPGAVAMDGALFGLNAVALLVAMTGFGLVMGDQTGVAPAIWVALLFGVILVVLRRENLNATVAAALIVGVAILALAGGMIVLGLLHVRVENVLAIGTGVAGPEGGASVIALVFGVLLFVYFGHTSAGNAARTVLRRDPSGRTLLWGNVAAMVAAGIIYGLFVIAVNGAVPAERLAAETGTAVAPLAEVAGPGVGVLGALYALLALGIGALYFALGLFNQAAEHLDRRISRPGWARFAVAAAPTTAIFVLMEVLLWFGAESFTGPLNLIGALVVPLLGGVFPMLLLTAARRRGERIPGTTLGALGSRVIVVAVIALYLGGVAAHALFIWTNPLERLVAAAATVAMLGLIAASARRRSYQPRVVVELRADEPPGGGMTVNVVADGQALPAEVRVRRWPGAAPAAVMSGRIEDFAEVEAIEVDLPGGTPSELSVWAHRPTRDGDTEPLEMEVEPARSGLDGSGTTLTVVRSAG
jgi:amino acid permease